VREEYQVNQSQETAGARSESPGSAFFVILNEAAFPAQ
jgi:hypothetical protein